MDRDGILNLLNFYRKELKDNILSFWLPRCVDTENGGFFNCFDNSGRTLVSRDKYTWSQGRFVWIWSKLASMTGDTFSEEEKDKFLKLAKHGRDFLVSHCLIGKDDWRCVFLMDEKGNPKYVDNINVLDASIFADCFVVAGIALYASVARDHESWGFAKNLYRSITERINNNTYHSLPYPLGKEYRMHSIPMIMTNLSCEMYKAAQALEPETAPYYMENIRYFSNDVLENFVDRRNVLHEIISSDNTFVDGVFGDHINPGHTIEDMWFQIHAADILNETGRISKIGEIAKNAFELGWDPQYGGYLHFTNSTGGEIKGNFENDPCNEPQLRLVYDDWGSKLWWVHSEALYTSLLLYFRTGEQKFLDYYRRTEEYTFSTFPNRDPSIGEWIQIRARDGKPIEKVVALPVKDPYHITRNFILIIELLEQELDKQAR
ncbi:hypothetical protein Cst_c27550 [Thermoclostridium stercorarium subsp. stercorarium DSM 8532]|jgi:N-acylglucosamine 2-epimerase|uniref:N-acylglucosamine 2-epimerase n=2 Tax=Thermoclostridium stercorarium TaxID=1510 RepID=L7VVZ0_THES1|nr:AGE family epimerase/isomerase [Thermoclostridium stercorarium]AGC69698.1 hypothetical protein Cst_c27550 [Thermoclostridium stercorarium subsp. stercorarium DSM 8532]AGI40650.1 N-acyl-D-glucosamine 2-epimerase [Thermoclostridium stercorarium subsp. stercorarium DSM 8532]ANX02540.1 hypothetical protein CSTERLE_13710 [Thermoclostridium stercorarium subsp. leptospartum DSM 9219]